MSLDQPSVRSNGERAAARRYMWEFLPAAAAYLVIFFGVTTWIDLENGDSLNVLWALLPVVPVVWMIVSVIRHVRRIDEFQRALVLQSFALGFGAAMLTAVVIALVGLTGIVVVGAEWYVFIVGMGTWGVASMVSTRR